MPYRLDPDDNRCVQVQQGGSWQRVEGGCHSSRDEAVDHLQALEANVTKQRQRILKVDEHEHLVFGFFNVSMRADGELLEDLHGDLIEPGELEKAAYEFVLDYREGGAMHKGTSKATLVESFVVTPEKLEKMGLPRDAIPPGWWGGFKVHDDDVFAKVLSGEYSMFSIEGEAARVEV